jgi:hypothetical protein
MILDFGLMMGRRKVGRSVRHKLGRLRLFAMLFAAEGDGSMGGYKGNYACSERFFPDT